MIKIRLSRGGRKKLPFYRILATNSTSPRDSRFLEKLGTFNPLLSSDNEQRIIINKERVEYWLSVGAKPTERVAKFLIELGVKGAEKYKPQFEAKAKGSNLKKKALEKIKKQQEAEEAAKVEAEEKAKAEEAAKAEAEEKAKAEEAAKVEAEEKVKAEETAKAQEETNSKEQPIEEASNESKEVDNKQQPAE